MQESRASAEIWKWCYRATLLVTLAEAIARLVGML